ncbi:MAG: hypothetical protein AAFN10_15455 [Bacteroidota bacterium]
MNLDELKNDWQAQKLAAIEPKLEKGALKHKFSSQLKAFERDHNAQAVLLMGIVLGLFALLSLSGWLLKGHLFSKVLTFSFGGTALFQIVRYYAIRAKLVPDVDIRAYLEQSLHQLRWHRYNVYVMSLIGAVPILSFGLVELLRDWATIDNASLIGLMAYFGIAIILVGLIYWYQKRFMYDTVLLKKEIQSILSEYTIN